MWFRRNQDKSPAPAPVPESLFDTATGSLNLGRGIRILPHMTLGEVTVQGLTFVRELPVGSGWLYCTTAPRAVGRQRFFFSLQTYCGQLTSVAFGFPLLPGMDPYRDALPILESYKAFLAQELGPAPTPENIGAPAEYTFPWGSITAHLDPRAGFSSMTLRWT